MNSMRLLLLVGQPCGLLGIIKKSSLLVVGSFICVPGDDRFLCSIKQRGPSNGHDRDSSYLISWSCGESVNIFVFHDNIYRLVVFLPFKATHRTSGEGGNLVYIVLKIDVYVFWWGTVELNSLFYREIINVNQSELLE